MPRFMALHSLGKGVVDRAMVDASAVATKDVPEITSYRSFINMEEGRAVRLVECPSRAWLEAYFKKISLPFDFLLPVEIEIVKGDVQTPLTTALCGFGDGV